ncbi:DUF397 domain-containing protein [Actinoallomurus sp. CA-150999]|uniref:DUF397 domain-containing protein n=1 Tax=Actinoallomurus sp. CA-150999 TaxID=3239887 RepID=UPI003D8C1BA4
MGRRPVDAQVLDDAESAAVRVEGIGLALGRQRWVDVPDLGEEAGPVSSRAIWRKSTRSNGGEGACVEVAALDEGVASND